MEPVSVYQLKVGACSDRDYLRECSLLNGQKWSHLPLGLKTSMVPAIVNISKFLVSANHSGSRHYERPLDQHGASADPVRLRSENEETAASPESLAPGRRTTA